MGDKCKLLYHGTSSERFTAVLRMDWMATKVSENLRDSIFLLSRSVAALWPQKCMLVVKSWKRSLPVSFKPCAAMLDEPWRPHKHMPGARINLLVVRFERALWSKTWRCGWLSKQPWIWIPQRGTGKESLTLQLQMTLSWGTHFLGRTSC